MKNKLVLLILLIFGLSGNISVAAPQVTEKISHETQVKFKPIYLDVPKTWKVATKANKTQYIISYFSSDDDFILGLVEQNSEDKTIDSSKSPTASTYTLNSITYHYYPYVGVTKGGALYWIDNGVYFNMDSHKLTKETMLKLAKTIKQ
ncbi:hypothetical protein J23TS9_12830 [Paenibacillus sp. J23TS9]|uniref:DUF4367 domain-containing protein n=1 Tax=Paenibacillus sp. J23TS9 TaxID=2807193 RepID=UPI001B0216DC|nr:DUF4367 domain-containing protein [Paenibacillus sp. J23TS9]GIP26153.1 hypothetical protein J23TS9_12830 [Paenibacillus sp. J23TS9]